MTTPAVPDRPAAIRVGRVRAKGSIVRSFLAYALAAIASIAILAWYLFGYIPPRLQYFMRFRSLGVAAGQLKSKADSLSIAVATAKSNARDADQYLEMLVPELGRGGSGLQFGEYTIAWEDLAEQAAIVSQADFDDLVLADESGRVLWQRERLGPRIGTIAELLQTRDVSDKLMPWEIPMTPWKPAAGKFEMPSSATTSTVIQNGSVNLLITQPVKVMTGAGERTLFLGGLLSRSALQKQAMHVPAEWVALAMLPFALIFLALPYIKLTTVTPKERYGLGDAMALGGAAILTAAIGGGMPFMAYSYRSDEDVLRSLANGIERNLTEDVSRFLRLTTLIMRDAPQIRTNLKECATLIAGMPPKRCDAWSALANGMLAASPAMSPGFAELDVISWVNRNGRQVEKWTTKQQITALIRQDFQHFHDIVDESTWTLRGRDEPFTMEPLRSPTTSEMAFVFAVPTFDYDIPMLSLNVKPPSLVDTLMPPGYGFAILAADGRVLFHSQSELSLSENFLREVDNPSDVTQIIRSGKDAMWTGDYHGRRYSFYTKRLGALENCPWQLVTFQEVDPLLAFTSRRQSGAIQLFVVNLLVILFIGAAYFLSARSHSRRSGDIVMSLFGLRAPAAVRASLLKLAVLTGIGVVALASTYATDPWWLTMSYAVFLVSPVAALAIVLWSRRNGHRGSYEYDRHEHWRNASELFLVTVLVGALPAAGMARVVHRLDRSQRTVQWLKDSQQQADARQERVRRSVMAARNYSTETKTLLLGPGGFAHAGRNKVDTPRPFSYQDQLLHIHPAPSTPAFETKARPLVDRWLMWLRSWFSGIGPVNGYTAVGGDGVHLQLLEADANGLHFTGDNDTGPARDLTSWSALAGAVVLFGTLLIVWSSQQTLSPRVALDNTPLAEAVAQLEGDGGKAPNRAILLVGPPRAEKDRIANEAVRKGDAPVLRIPLLDASLSSWWVDDRVRHVKELKKTSAGDGTLWILVSNLEAQLVDKKSRNEAFRLIEQLLGRSLDKDERRTALIVTSAIDPIAHFDELFVDERQETYANVIPEVELNRSSALLSRFTRCYVPLDGQSPWNSWHNYDPTRWPETLALETSCQRLLNGIGQDVAASLHGRKEVPMADLSRAVLKRAEASYQLLWTSCTRTEKLVLIHLAQEGLVNPKNRDTLDEIAAKGLVLAGPPPVLFNFTFRQFLRGIERADVINAWEKDEGNGMWEMSGRLVGSVLAVGGVFYLVTNGINVQSVLQTISGSGLLSLPIIKELLARLTAQKS